MFIQQPINDHPIHYYTYHERAAFTKNVTARQLFLLMEKKKTNLAVAADVTTKQKLLALTEAIGPYICMLKTHIDIIEDFDWSLIQALQALAEKHQFLLFEDRKFADIGSTSALQYSKGIYRIVEWADIINAHIVPGESIIDGLASVGAQRGKGLLLLAQMSSKGSYATSDFQKRTYALAQQYPQFIIGFIAQEKLGDDPRFIYCTPGVLLCSSSFEEQVQLIEKSDRLKQQYSTPEQAIKRGADIIIVGCGIYQAEDPRAAAVRYRDAGWSAYEQCRGSRNDES